MIFGKTERLETDIPDYEGRPNHYPIIADYPNLLFYIQRNQNFNSVIYELNFLSGGILDLHQPIKINWLQFGTDGKTETKELNYIQKKLAYGYHHKVISSDLLEFRFFSYDQMKFYLGKNKEGRFRVFSILDNINVEIAYMYVYSEDLGVFPQVKFVEFFGKKSCSGDIFYKKLSLE